MKTKKRASGKIGLSPGTLIHIGEQKAQSTRVRLIDYDQECLREEEVANIEDCFPFKDKPSVTWINIDGLHDTDLIAKIGNYFNIHPLILEDIVHTGTRPKIEAFDSHIFIVFKMLFFEKEKNNIVSEQFSIILGTNFVISFQEQQGAVFNPLRERIRNSKSRLRKKNADYLTYALIDTVVDNYFTILDDLEEQLEKLDEMLFTSMSKETFHIINGVKRKLITLRKAVSPIRELTNAVQDKDFELVEESNLIFFKDIHDHVIQILETIDTYRELTSGLQDIFLTNVNTRMNEIMKTLTITATIFIPLTFIAGIYGMNFQYMPELEWRWGYFGLWGLVICLVGVMFYYFKKKDWL